MKMRVKKGYRQQADPPSLLTSLTREQLRRAAAKRPGGLGVSSLVMEGAFKIQISEFGNAQPATATGPRAGGLRFPAQAAEGEETREAKEHQRSGGWLGDGSRGTGV